MNSARFVYFARLKAGLTQRQLAERAGISQPAIAKIESGRSSPRVDTLTRLLKPCGFRLTIEPQRGVGVDRTAMRELLRLTPEERLELAAIEGRNLEQFETELGG